MIRALIIKNRDTSVSAAAACFIIAIHVWPSQVGAAEVANPTSPSDWSTADRLNFTERWNRANVLNLMRGAPGAKEYQTIGQRTDFYNWFDQIRKVQGQEVMWPAAAWVVAGQMRNLEDPVKSVALATRRAAMGRNVDSDQMLEFASKGNQQIFEDVFPRVGEVFKRGLQGKPLVGDEARAWDQSTLQREQSEVVQPLYVQYAGSNPAMAAELKDLSSGSDVLSISGVPTAGALNFTGDILKADDRYNHGMNVVIPFYKRFETTVDSSRQRRQQAKPDPTAGGMVSVETAADQEKRRAEEAKKVEEAKRAADAKRAEEARRAEDARRAVESAQQAREAIEQQRRQQEQIETARRLAEQVEAARRAAEQAENARRAAEAAEIARQAAEQAEAARRAAEAAEAARRAAEAAARPPSIPRLP